MQPLQESASGVPPHSGDLIFALDGRSGFEVKFVTFSGDLDDELGLTVDRKKHSPNTRAWKGRYGSGDGSIRSESYSGSLQLIKK